MIVAFGESVADVRIGPALTGGVALFMAGDAVFRHVLGIGTVLHRSVTAVLALAAWPVAVAGSAAAGIALLTAVVAGALAVERRAKHATVEA